MKIFVFLIMLLLTGCSSLATEYGYSDNLLDTAPKNDSEVRHPEWGLAQVKARYVASGVKEVSEVRKVPYQVHTSNAETLEKFLKSNGVDYEVLPGNHVMVRLKDTVKFDTGSSKLSSQSANWLGVVSHFIAQQRGIDVVIDGYADSTGREAFNDSLSTRRADTVKSTLIKNNVSKTAIFTRGYGEYMPACSNDTIAGRACNRRVELLFIVSNN